MFILINRTRNSVEFAAQKPIIGQYSLFLNGGDDIVLLLENNIVVKPEKVADGYWECNYDDNYIDAVWKWEDEVDKEWLALLDTAC